MNSSRVLILARESEIIRELINGLTLIGYVCNTVSSEEELVSSKSADLLLIETGDGLVGSVLRDTVQRIKQERHIIVVLLAHKEALRDIENDSNIEDFVLKPYNPAELSVRIRRLLRRNKPREESAEYLTAGDINIDLSKCEVTNAGKVVDLTFTEYELLKLLISQKGHVLTREVLLDKIWGYDYFGGDRTVDVHITRLRNKIEDTTHTFIETVRNIGYRLKTNDK
ncbi:MAG: response regulator transcription factor [Dehalococcoidales bacterium]|nr:response regulator transcription factor [Dehalococcoidales bacterium]